MKQTFTLLLFAFSIFHLSSVSNAGALKPDCTVEKAGKNIAMKATVGVGGRCSPTDAAKDSAKDVTGIENKGKKDMDNPLKKDHGIKNNTLKKVIK